MGSEMCIRDSFHPAPTMPGTYAPGKAPGAVSTVPALRLSRRKSAQDVDSEPSGRISHTARHQCETPSSTVRLEECPSATVSLGERVSSASDNQCNTKARVLPPLGRSAAAQGDLLAGRTVSPPFVRVASGCSSVPLSRTAPLGVSLLVGAFRSLGVVARSLVRAYRSADRADRSIGFASRSPFPGPRCVASPLPPRPSRFSLLPSRGKQLQSRPVIVDAAGKGTTCSGLSR